MPNFASDLINGCISGIVFKPQVLTATTDGTILDAAGSGIREGGFLTVVSGTITDGGFSFALNESDAADLSASTAVVDKAGSAVVLAFTSAEDVIMKQAQFVRTKRYLRVTCTVTGSPSTGGPFAAIVQAQNSRAGGTATVP